MAGSEEAVTNLNYVDYALVIAGGVGVIPAVPSCASGTLKARVSNTANIVLAGGFAIEPGAALNIGGIKVAINVTGTNGDVLDVYQEYV